MKKTFVLISFILMSIIFPFKTKAYCDFEYKSRLMKQAGNINSVYIFDDDSKTFTITFNNIPEQFTIVDIKNNQSYEYSNREINLKGYQPGLSYQFDVRFANYDCYDEHLRSIYITLPVYNRNYTNPLCDGLENYSICQKWGKYIKDESEFKKEIKRIKNREKNDQQETIIQKSNSITQIIRIIQKYYFVEIPIVIIIFIVIYRKNKKGKSL